MKNVFIAGHNGMVGSALKRKLEEDSSLNVIVADRADLDLINQSSVLNFFKSSNIDEVYLAAAKVGGIHANNEYPGDFIYENLMIQLNIIRSAYESGIKKLLFLGSSCIYPKYANQPIKEECLLTGKLEPTNEPYAIAKIAGIKLCESYNRQYELDYRSVMPSNLYGERDNFHDLNSHVIPALISRFHAAKESKEKEVKVWGSGNAQREFLHVDDMASASIFIMNLNKNEYQSNTSSMCSHVNIGTGEDITIKQLAYTIKKITGYEGRLNFDSSKPDGAPKKLMDVSRLNLLGWSHKINLDEGLRKTYSWYLENIDKIRSK